MLVELLTTNTIQLAIKIDAGRKLAPLLFYSNDWPWNRVHFGHIAVQRPKMGKNCKIISTILFSKYFIIILRRRYHYLNLHLALYDV